MYLNCQLHLYRFKLSESQEDDLERLRNNNKYKLVTSYQSGTQNITSLSCINSFLSPLLLLTGSNRNVEIIDATTMQCSATLEDTHARPAHAIVQSAESSLYASHAKEAYELFATSSQDNTAKLWDVRSCRCVRTFSGQFTQCSYQYTAQPYRHTRMRQAMCCIIRLISYSTCRS